MAIKNPKTKPEEKNSLVDTEENKKRFSFDMPIALHTKLKIAAAKRGQTMAEIICNILEDNLKQS